MRHDELRNKINTLKTDYSSKGFSEIVEIIKREKINDDLLLQDLEECKRLGKDIAAKVKKTAEKPKSGKPEDAGVREVKMGEGGH